MEPAFFNQLWLSENHLHKECGLTNTDDQEITMNISRSLRMPMALAFLFSLSILLAGCGGGSDSSTSSGVTSTAAANTTLLELIDALPMEPLSLEEIESLLFMREEEKLARDVYLYLHSIWGDQIFINISDSEQSHTDAVLRLIEKYGLPDPAAGKSEGQFLNLTLQGLYDLLTAQGQASLIDALIVGAQIEDLDINDLHLQLQFIDNADMILVYENLLKGSRNHLRAFTGRLSDLGIDYVPAYISQEDFDAIISSPAERGQ
jgi:hypothetical protein